jgi:hypothetical protein
MTNAKADDSFEKTKETSFLSEFLSFQNAQILETAIQAF